MYLFWALARVTDKKPDALSLTWHCILEEILSSSYAEINYPDILGKLLCDEATLKANFREAVKRKTLKNTLKKWQVTEINCSSIAISILEIR